MALVHEIRRRARQIAPQVLFACTLAYFGYHAIHGDRGIMAWLKLKDEIAQQRTLQAEVASQRAELEHRVQLLRREHLDPDMLEERARLLLNYGYADEITVFLEPRQAPAGERD